MGLTRCLQPSFLRLEGSFLAMTQLANAAKFAPLSDAKALKKLEILHNYQEFVFVHNDLIIKNC